MGLFSVPDIKKSISNLFKGAPQEELLKTKKEQTPQQETKHDVNNAEPEDDDAKQELEEDEEDVDLEDAYIKKQFKTDSVKPSNVTSTKAEPVVEKSNYTIIVKNVPSECITDAKALRKLKKLLGPGIQSHRFRSIAMSEVMPRKVGFIQKKLHPSRNSVNCYICYKTSDQMYDVLNKKNGVEFLGHHLFLDNANNPKEPIAKQSVFVGNLSFEAQEEELYNHFKECGSIENVRIVRDRKVNLGKGFAYIQFDDPSTVQVALLKDGEEFEGRKLRVQRCSKQNKKPVSKPMMEKQTKRSKVNRKRKRDENVVMEGERAKVGDSLNFKKKKRTRTK